jgi:8-oxo-dGTP diphosphatase
VIVTPYVATDGIIELYEDGRMRGIVLIERKNPPYGLALPGGFVEVGESCEEALVREMMEETALEVEIERLLGVYSDPKRDSRFHTVSCVYLCRAEGEPRGGDDAARAFVYPLHEIPFRRLCFDHARILSDYLESRGLKA